VPGLTKNWRCGSCGAKGASSATGFLGTDMAFHLRTCEGRDDALYDPRFNYVDGVWECAWTAESEGWYRFSAFGERMIRAASA